jgi:type IV pilus assembly protein PilQ
VQEFLRGIALANNVNMSIANGLTDMVINNFNNVKFKDILVFLVKEYSLDIEILGVKFHHVVNG